jgi:hypothetical protein
VDAQPRHEFGDIRHRVVQVPTSGRPYRVVVREVERFEFFDAHRPVFTETVLF